MSQELFSLKGKKALVTGASRGLGLTIAKGLAHHGADVAIVGRDKTALQQAYQQIESYGGGAVWTFPFDLHHIDGIEEFFSHVVAAAGPIDILVNCAGIHHRGPAEEITTNAWNEVIQVNLTACFFLSQTFCKNRKSVGQGGKIINIGSLMCQAARPTTAPYTASKSGLLGLTKALAVEWAKYGINVNAIGPGYFATEMTDSLRADEKFNKWVLSNIPLDRWGDPEDLIGTAVFLASSASNYITGQIIYVDGGWLAGL